MMSSLKLLMISGLLLCGCRDTTVQKGDPTVLVTGTVTVDGQLLTTGDITFIEEDRSPRREYIAVIQAGKFQSQVPPGFRRVEIRSYQKPEKPTMNDGPYPQIIPARYNDKSELTAEIAGPEELSFELESNKE